MNVMGEYYTLEVRRDLVLNDALKSAQRKGFSVTKTIKVKLNICCTLLNNQLVYFQVSFVGEPGEDGGGPQRELWSLLGIQLRDQICHGVEGSVVFVHDSKGVMVS